MSGFEIGKRHVGHGAATYFIADISANHDGDLERAKELIYLAAAAGADAAKFQHFRAENIVSDRGFADLGPQVGHQARWDKPVFEVYREASLPWEWTEELRGACVNAGIEYFSTPYDIDTVEMLDPFVRVFKIGSGDITWTDMLTTVARKSKPVLLATGASDIGEIQRAVRTITDHNNQLCLMQCNTNYSGSLENFAYVNLNVLKTFALLFPEAVLGLSDHTPGHATVLGAVALGARVIEKHFTDDNLRMGPDHSFSMTPKGWREMVDRTRELELALGSAQKTVAENERDTVVVQRRCLRATRDLSEGTVLSSSDIIPLRPAPADSIPPVDPGSVVGKRVLRGVRRGQHLTPGDLE
ncbi:MAG: N-acetylneuraminate synthase family protein [Armatimonadetes bacterium]|nr:N-acetylneuraminate synthase family protein [Armatimonadota bacterium]